MSCGCDSTKTNVATVEEWSAAKIYPQSDKVKFLGLVYSSKGNIQTMLKGAFGENWPGPFRFNLGMQPPNGEFWDPVTDCYDGSLIQCQQAIITPPPPPIHEPPPVPLNPPVGFTEPPIVEPPPPPPMTEAEREAAEIAALPKPLIPIPVPSMAQIQEMFEDLDTKHMIIGMAGILTVILLIK